MQIIRQPKTYDVCIVGSGAGGGMAAKVLCEAAADVVMFEAGAMWDAAKESTRMGRSAGVRPERELPGPRCENLFVADAGPFVSNSHKNCTWTILALAMRTSEHIARLRSQGTL